MRFEHLNVECYGRFGEKSMNLRRSNGLVIIYGPNEAGKSTTRSAVTDLLFGIPSRTSLMEVFGGSKMAITAGLHLQNGSTLTIRRTKGNTNTLKDGDSNLLPETALASILGAVNKDRFESLFSLNHETLRMGGESLLKSNGEIGRMIVSAGGGLSQLVTRIANLDKACDGIYAPRKSNNRSFYIELEKFDAARKTITASQLTLREYQDNHKKLRELDQQIQSTRQDRGEILRSITKRERLARTLPHALELQRLRSEISAFSDLPEPGTEFSKGVYATLKTRDDLKAELSRVDSELSELRVKMESSAFDVRLPEHKAAINDASELAANVKRALGDRDKRNKELNDSLANLKPLMEIVGKQNAGEKDLLSMAPSVLILEETERLAESLRKLEQLIAAKGANVRESVAKCSHFKGQIQKYVGSGYDAPTGIDIAELNAADMLTEAREKQIRAEALRKRATDRCSRYAAAVPVCFEWHLPAEETVTAEAARRAEITDALRNCEQDKTRAQERKYKAQKDIDDLRRQGELPSEQDLQDARMARQQTWRDLKEAVLAEVTSAPDAFPTLAAGFETLVAEADRLADLRIREATRAATLQNAQYRLEDAEQEIVQISQRLEALLEKLEAQKLAWQLAWPEATDWQPEAAELLKAIRELELARKDWEGAADSEVEAAARNAEAALCLHKLTAAEARLKLVAVSDASIEARILEVKSRCLAHEDGYREWKAACSSLELEEQSAELRRQEVQELVEKRSVQGTRWAELMPLLGLAAAASVEDGDRAASLWAAASGHFDSAANTRRRLERMDEDQRALALDVERLAAATGVASAGSEIETAARLKAALDKALAAQQQRKVCEDQIAAKRPLREKLATNAAAAEVAVEGLCTRRNCDEEALRADCVRFDARNKLVELAASEEKSLRAAGDGLPTDTLLADAEGQDLDSIQAHLQDLKEQSSACESQLETALREHTELSNKQKNLLGETGILEAHARKESAYAALQQNTAEYLRMALARELLMGAMEKVRKERQDPLVKRASELFSRATLGAYLGLEAQPGSKDGEVAIVGCSEGRDAISVDKMSDGTRDQLYLAFRVAAVEQYCQSTEPLPFVADDLLVHFDDGRSRAALELLAELGHSTQVLLFTHHMQVRDAARELEKLGSATVVELS